ncbi:HEAT repeat-containing protein 3 isoform X1 [Erpetoichthys calabaricus]|uniref:HEAT repeat containing 3 n=2 Tax=Erpetoichthys calabaricus TaxID=27687 RepID=A0A8C4SQ55_ERPCA|nr:HEAT repeat-containing protein 3 isoform X1 [Erpetoichthys calabaricus]
MGKSKAKKFKRQHFSPTGLPDSTDVQVEQEVENCCPAVELLEKLQDPCPDVREYACASISRLVQETRVIPSFLQQDVVRCLGPMLLDKSIAVQETAAGALRNLSACGGLEVCDAMVKQDILTPLAALLQECSSRLNRSLNTMEKYENGRRNRLEEVTTEAIHLLWNLCESSSLAVSIFNKEGLINVLVQCLQKHEENMDLAICSAYCLQTVTEDNPELLASFSASTLQILDVLIMQSAISMQHLLLRTLVAGCVWNLKGILSCTAQAEAVSTVARILSETLEVDAGQVIMELKQAESQKLAEVNASMRPREEDAMDEESMKICCVPNQGLEDMSDLLPPRDEELKQAEAVLCAQQTALEILVNMCCSEEPSDDEWEEVSSSDESDLCAETCICDSGTDNQMMSPLCLSSEVHAALIKHCVPEKVIKKTTLCNNVISEICFKIPSWKTLVKKMQRVQCRALTCIQNMLSVMDPDVLGDEAALRTVAEHLSQLLFTNLDPPREEEFLEAVTSAIRSLFQVLASRGIPQSLGSQQFLVFSESALRCSNPGVRLNVVSILGVMGSTLSKQAGTAETLHMIGNFLLQVAMKDPYLMVVGEALDAIFDVFGDGKEAELAARSIQLLPTLRNLQPLFRAKIRKEGKDKYSSDQLCVLDNVKVNLRRFIAYQESLQKS